MAKLLVTFEKIVLTDGMMLGGRKPATRITMEAQSKAYSIMSWPFSSRHNFFSLADISFSSTTNHHAPLKGPQQCTISSSRSLKPA